MATEKVTCATEGCDGYINISERNRRDADYRARKMMERGWTCRDCDNREAAIRADAAGMPTLTGSEKQVAWAVSLRETTLGWFHAQMLRASDMVQERGVGVAHFVGFHDDAANLAELILSVGRDTVDAAAEEMRGETDARWWIDRRDETIATTLRTIIERIAQVEKAMSPEGKAAAAAEQDAMAEATLRPAAPVSETIAEISFRAGKLVARYDERSDDFNGTVKRLGYGWEPAAGAWVRTFQPATMGLAVDRVAETAHELLAAGIVVAVHDPEARAKAADRSYEPEHRRWISLVTSGPHQGKFRLTWGRDEDFYGRFRGLRGAAYKDKACLVPATSRDELLDFAEAHGFRLTERAQARAAEVMEQRERGLVVAAVARETPELVDERRGGAPVALAVPGQVEIDDDLVDDD